MEEPTPVSETINDQNQKTPIGIKKVRGLWINLALWGLMILYLLISPAVEMKYFIHEGKPVQLGVTVPENTDQIRHSVDIMRKYWVNGEEIHMVVGWSFLITATDLSQYDIYLVLDSGTRQYFFPAIPTRRGDIQKAFPEETMDLTYAGFVTHIAKETITRGKHAVGLLYVNKTTGEMTYQETSKSIICTPNTLRLEK